MCVLSGQKKVTWLKRRSFWALWCEISTYPHLPCRYGRRSWWCWQVTYEIQGDQVFVQLIEEILW